MPEFPCHWLYNERRTVDWMSDCSWDSKCSPMMDTKRKFWLFRVCELWSVKGVRAKRFPGSWSYYGYSRCCAATRESSIPGLGVFAKLNAVLRNDCQFLRAVCDIFRVFTVCCFIGKMIFFVPFRDKTRVMSQIEIDSVVQRSEKCENGRKYFFKINVWHRSWFYAA